MAELLLRRRLGLLTSLLLLVVFACFGQDGHLGSSRLIGLLTSDPPVVVR